MGPSIVWHIDARARRFLESTAIKSCQVLEQSGWLDRLQRGDIVAVEDPHGRGVQCGVPEAGDHQHSCQSSEGTRAATLRHRYDHHALPSLISRTLAMDHLETANANGFNEGSVGCPIVIADG